MPRPRQMQRSDETKLNEEDAELLQQVENMTLPYEQQEAVETMKARLNRYGKLTTSDRKFARRLLKAR